MRSSKDELTGPDGRYHIEGTYTLLIHSKATAKEKVQIMIDALRRFGYGDIYIMPTLRDLLEKVEDR